MNYKNARKGIFYLPILNKIFMMFFLINLYFFILNYQF